MSASVETAPLLVLTRPPRETRASARALAARGFASVCMPLQYTRTARLTQALEAQLRWAEGAELQIFVSRASVAAACKLAPGAVSAAVVRFAVGRATAEALSARGYTCTSAAPHAEDSEGLLDSPALAAVAGRHIVIWIAPGGRDLIAQRLRERGAEVRSIAVYQRVNREPEPAALQQLRANISQLWLTATSAALVARLAHSLRAHGLIELLRRPLIVASERIARSAADLGFERVHIARGASPEALLGALEQYRLTPNTVASPAPGEGTAVPTAS